MRIPRSRGAVSGLLLIILGAWGALVPFIGPSFGLVIGPDDMWNWSADRFWLSVLPGVVAVAGGLVLLQSAHRGGAGLGAWMGILAGAWFALGPLVSRLWTDDGASALGQPAGGTDRQVLELLVMYEGLGVLMAAIAAFALGRLTLRSVRDVELDEPAELQAQHEPVVDGPGEERFHRAPEPDREPEPERTPEISPEHEPEPVTAAAAAPAPATTATTATTPSRDTSTDDAGAMHATRPMPTTPPPTQTRRSGGLLSRLRRR